eukprot:8268687-Heterocapsa_arctica.AAC.1
MSDKTPGIEGGNLVGSHAAAGSMIKPGPMREQDRERDPLKELPFLPAPLAGDPGAPALSEAQQRVTHL